MPGGPASPPRPRAGRTARRPWEDIRQLRPRETLIALAERYREHEVLTYASAISFQAFFALFPLALFALGVLGSLHLQEVWRRDLAPEIRTGFSPAAFRVVDDTVRQVLERRQLVWATLGAVIALWELSGAVRAVMGILNRVYGAAEHRGLARRLAVSIALSTAVGLLVLSAVAVVQFGPLAAQAVLGRSAAVVVAAFLARWVVAVALLLLAVALLVRFAPDTARPWRWVTFGAAVSVGGWIAMSLIFAWYLSHIADYRSLYGNLATVIVVLEYVYISAIVFVTGVLIDALTRERADRERPAAGAPSRRGRGP
jgi:membrane protein